MHTWQYQLQWLTVSPGDWHLSVELNTLGSSGWELVTVEPAGQSNGLPQYLFIFKKQLS